MRHGQAYECRTGTTEQRCSQRVGEPCSDLAHLSTPNPAIQTAEKQAGQSVPLLLEVLQGIFRGDHRTFILYQPS
jgi:hypothetical protein